MNKNEIINADDYIVKLRNFTIQNGPFKGYGFKTKVVESSLNCELFASLDHGEKVDIKFQITPVRDVEQKDLVNVCAKEVAKEVVAAIKKVSHEVSTGKTAIPENLPYLDYFFILPRELLLDSDYCEQILEQVKKDVVEYGMDKTDKEKQIIKEAFSNFTKNDLIDLSNETRAENEKNVKFANDINNINPYKK